MEERVGEPHEGVGGVRCSRCLLDIKQALLELLYQHWRLRGVYGYGKRDNNLTRPADVWGCLHRRGYNTTHHTHICRFP